MSQRTITVPTEALELDRWLADTAGDVCQLERIHSRLSGLRGIDNIPLEQLVLGWQGSP